MRVFEVVGPDEFQRKLDRQDRDRQRMQAARVKAGEVRSAVGARMQAAAPAKAGEVKAAGQVRVTAADDRVRSAMAKLGTAGLSQ